MSRIKESFVSRWGKDGQIVQVDFSQLEVIGVAFLSQDPMMYEDILNNVDSHCQSASWLTEYSYEEMVEGYQNGIPHFAKIRKAAKAPRFQLQYLSRAKGISESCGIPLKVAQGFIDKYYGRYSVLKQWQEDNFELARTNRHNRERVVIDKETGEEKIIRWQVCKLPSITGREYTFREYPTPEFIQERDGIFQQIKDTQVGNYPSQGFATGDVVPMMLGKAYRRLKQGPMAEKALMIGTIHDSALFDVHNTAIEGGFCQGMNKFMEKAPEFIEETWGFKFDLPLRCETEAGPNWADMKRVV